MRTYPANLAGLAVLNDEVCIRIECPPLKHVCPGQYLLAFSVDSTEILPTVLFPCLNDQDGFIFTGKLPKDWRPGTALSIRGPFGNGFHIPALTKRVALTTFDQCNINRLLGLAELALLNGAEVTLLTDVSILQLAPEIEVLPLSALSEIKSWADYFAVILPISSLNDLKKMLSLNPGRPSPFVAEVMLETPLVCADVASCGVCSVLTTKGWKHACKEGPVFQLEELLEEDQPHG